MLLTPEMWLKPDRAQVRFRLGLTWNGLDEPESTFFHPEASLLILVTPSNLTAQLDQSSIPIRF
jgi:hypothetical protein